MSSQSPFPPAQKPLIPAPRTRFASFRAIVALMLREMSTEHGRSPGGYLWAVLDPVIAIALLTFIFSIVLRAPQIGINFAIFYATGMLPFSLFNDIAGKTATSVMFSKPLLAYPTVTFLDALLARLLVNILTQVMVWYVVLGGILTIYETRTILDLPVVIGAFSMAVCLGIGVGAINCLLFAKFPLWQKIWSLATRPLFLVSCIFHLFDEIPQPYRDYLWWNPLVHVIGYMRHGFYQSYDAAYVSLTYVWLLGLGMLLIGLIFLRRFHRDLIND